MNLSENAQNVNLCHFYAQLFQNNGLFFPLDASAIPASSGK